MLFLEKVLSDASSAVRNWGCGGERIPSSVDMGGLKNAFLYIWKYMIL